MREFKFRIFDKLEDEFLNEEDYAINFIGTLFQANLDEEVLNVLDKNRYIITQYTGLKDINKEEIYEGDYMLDGHSGSYGEVKFYNGAFVIEFDNEIQDLFDWTGECIIGNIFETKLIGK